MEKIRELINKPLVAAGLGFILGLIIGLPILGWWLTPVRWTDAGPQQLREDLQKDYMRMSIESYGINPDDAKAKARWDEFGSGAEDVFNSVLADPTVNPDWAARFINASQGSLTPIEPNVEPEAVVGEQPEVSAPAEEEKAGINPVMLLVIFCGLTLVVGGALVYVLVLRKRKPGAAGGSPMQQAADYNREAELTDYVAEGQAPPVSQFMTTYMLGDDLYDDSFSIDSPTGEFLGECGVGISDTIGVGDPKKVTAFEVWLFDKNDIQTVTKVLMSEHAYNDPTISQRLASKGEPVLIMPGERILLETATLQLEARVVDVNYGQGALPTNSFLDRSTLELSVWNKPGI